jgi:hypothetical protein
MYLQVTYRAKIIDARFYAIIWNSSKLRYSFQICLRPVFKEPRPTPFNPWSGRMGVSEIAYD